MIKKFHVLYVGQIELDNIGLNGTPANDRRYSDERLREVFSTVKDVAQTMDELNFDVLWMAEHHAMADIVTDGRVIMGVGRGYHTREVETFGAPLIDAEKNCDFFEEQLQLLLTCFNEPEFKFKGKFYECPPEVPYRGYTVKDITLVPRPKHLPVE